MWIHDFSLQYSSKSVLYAIVFSCALFTIPATETGWKHDICLGFVCKSWNGLFYLQIGTSSDASSCQDSSVSYFPK